LLPVSRRWMAYSIPCGFSARHRFGAAPGLDIVLILLVSAPLRPAARGPRREARAAGHNTWCNLVSIAHSSQRTQRPLPGACTSCWLSCGGVRTENLAMSTPRKGRRGFYRRKRRKGRRAEIADEPIANSRPAGSQGSNPCRLTGRHARPLTGRGQ
jgi:hypothetical protein